MTVVNNVAAEPAIAAPTPWLVARRLALREFHAGDVDDIVAMHRDPRVRAALVDDHPLDEPAVARLLVDRLQWLYRARPGLGIWHASAPVANDNATVSDDEPDRQTAMPACRFVGWFNLMPMTDQPGEVEIGSRLRPEVWGSQLAFDGCDALLRHAFDDPRRTQVWAVTHPVNRPAMAVLSSLGFAWQGIQRYEGGSGLHCVITRDRWQASASRPRRERLRSGMAALRAWTEGREQGAEPASTTTGPLGQEAA